jgi:4-amino-4-deoxy-L-arabinose transferase-like glycosyltransferase
VRARPRLRRWLKWSGAIVSALSTALWIASVFGVTVGLQRGTRNAIAISSGGIIVLRWGRTQGSIEPFASVSELPSGSRIVWFELLNYSPGFWRFTAPCWPFPAIALVPTVIAWRNDCRAKRRRRECLRCGYSLAGLDRATRCPECGAKWTAR